MLTSPSRPLRNLCGRKKHSDLQPPTERDQQDVNSPFLWKVNGNKDGLVPEMYPLGFGWPTPANLKIFWINLTLWRPVRKHRNRKGVKAIRDQFGCPETTPNHQNVSKSLFEASLGWFQGVFDGFKASKLVAVCVYTLYYDWSADRHSFFLVIDSQYSSVYSRFIATLSISSWNINNRFYMDPVKQSQKRFENYQKLKLS